MSNTDIKYLAILNIYRWLGEIDCSSNLNLPPWFSVLNVNVSLGKMYELAVRLCMSSHVYKCFPFIACALLHLGNRISFISAGLSCMTEDIAFIHIQRRSYVSIMQQKKLLHLKY